jgi:hypothetical protein
MPLGGGLTHRRPTAVDYHSLKGVLIVPLVGSRCTKP